MSRAMELIESIQSGKDPKDVLREEAELTTQVRHVLQDMMKMLNDPIKNLTSRARRNPQGAGEVFKIVDELKDLQTTIRQLDSGVRNRDKYI